MSAKNDGGPAFPHVMTQVCKVNKGMTLRDWFAGQALAGMAASDYWCENFELTPGRLEAATKTAYAAADAMLKAREQ